jgi:hypothetical protein
MLKRGAGLSSMRWGSHSGWKGGCARSTLRIEPGVLLRRTSGLTTSSAARLAREDKDATEASPPATNGFRSAGDVRKARVGRGGRISANGLASAGDARKSASDTTSGDRPNEAGVAWEVGARWGPSGEASKVEGAAAGEASVCAGDATLRMKALRSEGER